MKNVIFCNLKPCSSLEVSLRFGRKFRFSLQAIWTLQALFVLFISESKFKWGGVPKNLLLNFNSLYGIMFQDAKLFGTTAVRIPISYLLDLICNILSIVVRNGIFKINEGISSVRLATKLWRTMDRRTDEFEIYVYVLLCFILQTLNLKLQQMSWPLERKYKLSLENKLLVFKCILKPIWTYGIQLWGCTKPSNTKVLQRFQSNVLRSITNAPWYVSNLTLHRDLQIRFVTEEIKKYYTIH
jgi:hypothetical protein